MLLNRYFCFPLVCAALLLVLGGCERAVPRTDYFPLRDGNRWEYRLLDNPLLGRLKEGQAVVTAPSESDEKSSAAENESELSPKAETVETENFSDPNSPAETNQKNGSKKKSAKGRTDSAQPAMARRVVLELRSSVDELTYRALYDTAEQVWSKRNGYIGFQSTRGRSYLLILPPHTGYKWTVTAPGGQNFYFEIETADGRISTPAGLFEHCAVARQESRDRKEIHRYWFAPDVGLVRRSKFIHDEEVFRQELVEFKVKPATPATRLAEEHEVRTAVAGKSRGSEFRDSKDKRAHQGEKETDSKLDSVNEKVQDNSTPR